MTKRKHPYLHRKLRYFGGRTPKSPGHLRWSVWVPHTMSDTQQTMLGRVTGGGPYRHGEYEIQAEPTEGGEPGYQYRLNYYSYNEQGDPYLEGIEHPNGINPSTDFHSLINQAHAHHEQILQSRGLEVPKLKQKGTKAFSEDSDGLYWYTGDDNQHMGIPHTPEEHAGAYSYGILPPRSQFNPSPQWVLQYTDNRRGKPFQEIERHDDPTHLRRVAEEHHNRTYLIPTRETPPEGEKRFKSLQLSGHPSRRLEVPLVGVKDRSHGRWIRFYTPHPDVDESSFNKPRKGMKALEWQPSKDKKVHIALGQRGQFMIAPARVENEEGARSEDGSFILHFAPRNRYGIHEPAHGVLRHHDLGILMQEAERIDALKARNRGTRAVFRPGAHHEDQGPGTITVD